MKNIWIRSDQGAVINWSKVLYIQEEVDDVHGFKNYGDLNVRMPDGEDIFVTYFPQEYVWENDSIRWYLMEDQDKFTDCLILAIEELASQTKGVIEHDDYHDLAEKYFLALMEPLGKSEIDFK